MLTPRTSAKIRQRSPAFAESPIASAVWQSPYSTDTMLQETASILCRDVSRTMRTQEPTIAKRPDLAAEVVSMQLINHPGGYREYHEDANVTALQALLAWSDSHDALSVVMLTQSLDKGCPDTDLPFNDWKISTHRWVMSLAMLLAVKVKDVVIAVDEEDENCQAFPELDDASNPPKMLAFRTLGIMSWGANSYPLASVCGLLRAAPNLETFYAVDACDHLHWECPSPRDHCTYMPLP